MPQDGTHQSTNARHGRPGRSADLSNIVQPQSLDRFASANAQADLRRFGGLLPPRFTARPASQVTSSSRTLTFSRNSAQTASVSRKSRYTTPLTSATSTSGTSVNKPRDISQSQSSKSSTNPYGTDEGTVVPEDFLTPQGRYTRLGRLLTKSGQTVPGGMNEGLYLVRSHRSNRMLVEKRLSVSRESQQRRTRAEIAALTLLLDKGPHSNINRICESFYPGMTSYTCLLLSFCEEGSVAGYIDRQAPNQIFPSEDFAWHVLQSLTSALAFCHFGINLDLARSSAPMEGWKTLCHLDVKPDNVFLTNESRTNEFPRVVLGDFGCCVTQDDIESGYAHAILLTHGTPNWLPPEARPTELLAREGTYGKATDIWQVGATVQALCRLVKVPDMQQARQLRPVGSTRYSRILNSLVSGCMEDDVKKRPTALDAWRYASGKPTSGR